MVYVGVARPTRGIEYSESAQSIERNLIEVPHAIERCWWLGIPDSFNYLSALLLRNKTLDYIWFVEEDVVVPEGGFEALLELDADLAAIEYPAKKGLNYKRDQRGDLVWLSTGCLLVRRRVFDSLDAPWFKGQYTVGSIHEGSSCREKKYVLLETDHPYGGHDCYFTWTAKEAGFSLALVDGMMAGHLLMKKPGASDSNYGVHEIINLNRGVKRHGAKASV